MSRNAEEERAYSTEYRRRKRLERDAHIDRWLAHGMSPDEIVFACGYHPGTVKARVLAAAEVVAR